MLKVLSGAEGLKVLSGAEGASPSCALSRRG